MALPTTELSLCAGIGGMSLGLRRAVAGLRAVCYVEREAFAASVLVARMEAQALDCAPVWDDLATFDGRPWRGKVDIVSGGTPCQDLSGAGRQRGLDGERSGLFWEFCRIIEEVRPQYVFWENVASGATGRALPRVVGALEDLGLVAARGPDGRPYLVLGADDVGAPHRRLRVFVLAYSAGSRCDGSEDLPAGRDDARTGARRPESERGGQHVAYSPGKRRHERQRGELEEGRRAVAGDGGEGRDLANPHGRRRESNGVHLGQRGLAPGVEGGGSGMAHAHGGGKLQQGRGVPEQRGWAGDGRPEFPPGPGDADAWRAVLERWPYFAPAQPRVRRVADGVSGWLDRARADRLRALGNACVPAQAELAWNVLWKGR